MIESLILLGLLFLIVLIHEAGHLIAAKYYGVGVPVYSIGFGPRLIGFKFYKGNVSYKILNGAPSNLTVWEEAETEYRIAPIPFGGFCSMEGEIVETNKKNSKDLASKPYYQKVVVAMGGAIANIITGFAAIVAVLAPNLGFFKAVKNTFLALVATSVEAYHYTLLLFTGKEPLAKWGEITEGVAQISGIGEFTIYFGILSVIMALFNLIPFPALDGSLPILWGLEKVFGKKKGQKIAHVLAMFGIIILMTLQVLIVVYWFLP